MSLETPPPRPWDGVNSHYKFPLPSSSSSSKILKCSYKISVVGRSDVRGTTVPLTTPYHFVTGKADACARAHALKCVHFEGPWVVPSTFSTITFIKVKNTAQKPLKTRTRTIPTRFSSLLSPEIKMFNRRRVWQYLADKRIKTRGP